MPPDRFRQFPGPSSARGRRSGGRSRGKPEGGGVVAIRRSGVQTGGVGAGAVIADSTQADEGDQASTGVEGGWIGSAKGVEVAVRSQRPVEPRSTPDTDRIFPPPDVRPTPEECGADDEKRLLSDSFLPGNVPAVVLPCPLTPMIGRLEVVQEIVGSLQTTRLVTLTGGGGVGKTRLALQLAQGWLQRGDVGFVELAALTNPSLLAKTVATACLLAEEPGRSAALHITPMWKHDFPRAFLLYMSLGYLYVDRDRFETEERPALSLAARCLYPTGVAFSSPGRFNRRPGPLLERQTPRRGMPRRGRYAHQRCRAEGWP